MPQGKKPKPKKCRMCQFSFNPHNSLQIVCSPGCAIKKSNQDRAKKQRKELKERKEKIKTRTQWLNEAQKVFNKYIRERDKNEPCISCGKPPGGNKFGGIWVASHYKSVASSSELRFNELNVHKACVKCNSWLSGNIKKYRPRLIEKIGLQQVDWLEGYHKLFSWSVEDAKEIKKEYKAKTKELKMQNSGV